MSFRSVRFLSFLAVVLLAVSAGYAGQPRYLPDATAQYKVLPPLTQGELTLFPLVAAQVHDTSGFLTLDEGLRSGEVVVSEMGSDALHRRRPGQPLPMQSRAQVNRLALVNNSDKPLILLAGEIVTGGKQDRVVGKDRIVPAHSDPVDLSVFCVEPGRWTGASANFSAQRAPMAQPSVRARAMADKDQQKVWDAAGKARESVAASLPATRNSSSYAQVFASEEVQQQVDAVAAPLERSYQKLITELRQRNAVGVVVAVGDRIIWADAFASPSLLQKYWPKLVRSYAAEAITAGGLKATRPNRAQAQEFISLLSGAREFIQNQPGVYRHTEVDGDGYRVFRLAALLPKTEFDVHLSKMAE